MSSIFDYGPFKAKLTYIDREFFDELSRDARKDRADQLRRLRKVRDHQWPAFRTEYVTKLRWGTGVRP